jgi:hypothetical protein
MLLVFFYLDSARGEGMISFHNEFVPIAADELHIPALL